MKSSHTRDVTEVRLTVHVGDPWPFGETASCIRLKGFRSRTIMHQAKQLQAYKHPTKLQHTVYIILPSLDEL